MKSNSITQITGTSGKLIGGVAIQTSGSLTMKIVGDTLQTKSEEFFGLETKEIFVPIQDVKGVEIGEGCTWWLLWLGISTLWFFIGIIFIVLAFVVKQRYIAIYTTRNNLILFYRKTERVEQFRNAVLEAGRPKPTYIPRSSQSPPAPPSLPKPSTTLS